MVAYITTLVRALLLTVALVFVTQTADAGRHMTEQTTTARTANHTKAEPPVESDDLPLDGLLLIAGVVVIVVLVAWVGSRIGDNHPHVLS